MKLPIQGSGSTAWLRDPEEQQIRKERQEMRREALAGLLDSEGWKRVLQPALLARMERISRGIATGSDKSVEAIRLEQGKYRELCWLVGLTRDDAKALFPVEND